MDSRKQATRTKRKMKPIRSTHKTKSAPAEGITKENTETRAKLKPAVDRRQDGERKTTQSVGKPENEKQKTKTQAVNTVKIN